MAWCLLYELCLMGPARRDSLCLMKLSQCRMLQTARNPDDIRWLPGARMNIAQSALSMRDPDAPALIWAAEEAPDALHTLSLGELRSEALRFAAALRKAGFSPGESYGSSSGLL